MKQDKEYEKQNPSMSDTERMEHYYRTRAPDADLLADIDAWGTIEQVATAQQGTTISAIISSVYGRGRANSKGAPNLRKVAIKRFLDRHGLTVANKNIVTTANRDILQYYIADFGRVWIYNRQQPRSFWIGSSYDKRKLQQISRAMAQKFLQWLDALAKSNGVY
ncbi:MAG: hypothetical protein MJE77_48165 [Proteobacteria bacterium]|nr:hypothetical protein [Pseudomonadota bacterium]